MMNDLISKSAAQAIPPLPRCYREYATSNLDDAYDEGWEHAMFSLNTLPTIEPKKGKWKHDADGLVWCFECGFGKERSDERPYNYCPNCGAKMDVADNDVGKMEMSEE